MTRRQIKLVLEFTPAHVSDREVDAIQIVTNLGSEFGFGNMMAWLSTAWTIHHVEKGIKPKDAIKMVHGTPYPLPKDL